MVRTKYNTYPMNFTNEPDDIDWFYETHAQKPKPANAKSLIYFAYQDDYIYAADVYASDNPTMTEDPIESFTKFFYHER